MIYPFKKNEQAYSLVELTVVMLLLVIFGLGVFVLAASASSTYEALTHDKNQSMELRIASSYLTTKLRQNDAAESIEIVNQDAFPTQGLKIYENLGENDYVTWIYLSDGFLREATVLLNSPVSDDISFVIAEIDGLTITAVDNYSVSMTLSKGDAAPLDIYISLKTKQFVLR